MGLTCYSVPENCSFEIDDLDKEWIWPRPFNFIFSRVMASCFIDSQAYINIAYKCVSPICISHTPFVNDHVAP